MITASEYSAVRKSRAANWQSMNWVLSVTSAVAPLNTAKPTTVIIIIVRRPQRSA